MKSNLIGTRQSVGFVYFGRLVVDTTEMKEDYREIAVFYLFCF